MVLLGRKKKAKIDEDEEYKRHSDSSDYDDENPYYKEKHKFEKIHPPGSLGRKSFTVFPGQKKHFWREEALKLRKTHLALIPFHVVAFFVDFIIYDYEIFSILFEMLFIWMNYYNYMTLNKLIIGAEVLTYALCFVISLTHAKRVLYDINTWTPMWFFMVHYWIIYPLAGITVGRRLRSHFER